MYMYNKELASYTMLTTEGQLVACTNCQKLYTYTIANRLYDSLP